MVAIAADLVGQYNNLVDMFISFVEQGKLLRTFALFLGFPSRSDAVSNRFAALGGERNGQFNFRINQQ
ncbi:hypothetical protein [Candidatus Magnetaquicoccus inordinatus]|uniref:hypothetical protein n=1 Tax=Candidatus Magnetaquicoccus inordinatus TaxID=2496818 RepID=UPI00102BB0BD|nr:hypothetical protein [Candidatus Magnetaquicoccus inordinatus]